MNKDQRDSNRRNARQLETIVHNAEMARHRCENCGEPGGHWISTRGSSLEALITGIDDQEGFWTCQKLYGEDGRRLVA